MMTPEQFVFWLQGFMETANPKVVNETQTQIIKDHLALVFNKETPDRREKVNRESTGNEELNKKLEQAIKDLKIKDFPPYNPYPFPDHIYNPGPSFPPGTIIC
jgi:hypothetical protein